MLPRVQCFLNMDRKLVASLMQETIQIYFGETKLVHCEISLSAVGTDPHLVGRGRLSLQSVIHRAVYEPSRIS